MPSYLRIKEAQDTDTRVLTWEDDAQTAFQKLKQVLLNTPAWSLQTGHLFHLYVDQGWGMALGVLKEDPEPSGL